MSPEELEAEALKLDSKSRARLAGKLLDSLEYLSEAENEKLWIEEAQRRNTQMDADPDSGIPADDVFREARSRVGWP
jgi:putative addiction module component (TIGR02574 family)